MKPNRFFPATIGAAAVAISVVFTLAFAQQSETITVDIDDIANDIAVNIGADASRIPGAVQASIDVASKVCGIPSNVLKELIEVRESCTATTTSPALEQIVQRQVSAKK